MRTMKRSGRSRKKNIEQGETYIITFEDSNVKFCGPRDNLKIGKKERRLT